LEARGIPAVGARLATIRLAGSVHYVRYPNKVVFSANSKSRGPAGRAVRPDGRMWQDVA